MPKPRALVRTLRFPLARERNVCYHYFVICATYNQRSALHSSVRRCLLRWSRYVPAALQRLVPRALALIVVLVLGVLSPLSCVIHCFIQERIAERSALAFFLCGEHAVAVPEDVDLLDRLSIVGSTVDEPLTPRALYELLLLPLTLLISTILLLAAAPQYQSQRTAPATAPPPTPPPRLSCA
ncbi:MAG: hypothetical protein HC828_19085 [Blastochloris sp.]|nr:hypothetical protein [Blastochloris sp.]